MRTKLDRKEFLKAAGAGASLLGASTLAAACARPGPSPKRPETPSGRNLTNVILVILDSLRKDHVGAYGNDRVRTPTLDALAKQSLRFTRAHPEAMPTIPARRAIHTGMRTFPFKDRLEEQERAPIRGWLPIPEEQATLAETLKEEGYRTMLVTDTYHQFFSPMNFHRGFDTFTKIRGQENDAYVNPAAISEEKLRRYVPARIEKTRQYLANTQGRRNEEDWFAPRVFTEATKLLEQAAPTGANSGRPFFLVVDSYDPHEPWDPPQEYVELYHRDGYEEQEPISPQYGRDDYLTVRQLLRMRALYAAEVTMTDHWLGGFLQRARELGVMENTLLVVISDHGHLLGEHGYTGKLHYALYPELTDIVLLIRHPAGKQAGQTTDYYASTHDVTPTILGFLGIDAPAPMEGKDLSVLMENKSPETREYSTLGYGRHVWCLDEGYVAFCRDDLEGAKLFDVHNDPRRERDLAGDEPERVERMFKEYVLRDAGGALPPS
jgi:arylsulfatase A-like enzyme